MAKKQEYQIVPGYGALLGLRDFGYSFKEAIADVVDNSIDAHASKIELYATPNTGDPEIYIIDNGLGMTNQDIKNALEFGQGKREEGEEEEQLPHGKYGFGLKTASLSQCAKITVISKKTKLYAWQLDLEFCKKKNGIYINSLPETEIKKYQHLDKIEESGTIVVWQNFDRFKEKHQVVKSIDDHFNAEVFEFANHLSLILHRFITGEQGIKKLNLLINNRQIEAFDPFFDNNKATQKKALEVVGRGKEAIKIIPYIIPDYPKIKKSEYNTYKNFNDFKKDQGLYVYRNKRLIKWGSWFGLHNKEEQSKLARIKIDFKSSEYNDKVWGITVEKTKVVLPPNIKKRLKELISLLTQPSKNIIRGKGKEITLKNSEDHIWKKYTKNQKISYEINKDNLYFKKILNKLDPEDKKIFNLLKIMIESDLPKDSIYRDVASQPHEIITKFDNEQDVINELNFMLEKNKDCNAQDPGFKIVALMKVGSENVKHVDKFIKSEAK